MEMHTEILAVNADARLHVPLRVGDPCRKSVPGVCYFLRHRGTLVWGLFPSIVVLGRHACMSQNEIGRLYGECTWSVHRKFHISNLARRNAQQSRTNVGLIASNCCSVRP
jgi:hypothetical protein